MDPRRQQSGVSADTSRWAWVVVPVGVLILMCLGSVYSWSVFMRPLQAELQLSATQAMLPYTVALAFYAATMPLGGFVIARIGARATTAIGGVVVGLGYFLSSQAADHWLILLTYGVIAGAGVGIAYGAPLAVSARAFPHRRGLAVGTTVIGFGLSPLVTAPLAQSLISSFGVRQTLLLFGVGIAVVLPLLALLLRPGGAAVAREDTAAAPPTSAIFGKRSFYGLWSCFVAGTMVGLAAIGISAVVGQDLIGIDPKMAAWTVAVFAICNGVSRPLCGWLIDRHPPHRVALAAYTLMLGASLLMLTAGPGDVLTYVTAFCLFWFCLGGWLAIAPASTLRLFDARRYPQHYGIVFTAYGVGAVTGTVLVGQIRDATGSYTACFVFTAGVAAVGMMFAMTLLRGAPKLPHGASQ